MAGSLFQHEFRISKCFERTNHRLQSDVGAEKISRVDLLQHFALCVWQKQKRERERVGVGGLTSQNADRSRVNIRQSITQAHSKT